VSQFACILCIKCTTGSTNTYIHPQGRISSRKQCWVTQWFQCLAVLMLAAAAFSLLQTKSASSALGQGNMAWNRKNTQMPNVLTYGNFIYSMDEPVYIWQSVLLT
jgi:hypothetical protein